MTKKTNRDFTIIDDTFQKHDILLVSATESFFLLN
jgi:hypothetical protein